MINKKIITLLSHNHMDYSIFHHDVTYTAQETAEATHISGHEFAKTILLKVDGKPMMAVLPADTKISFKHIKEITGAKRATLADEEAIHFFFDDCDIGAMPPFGNMYRIPVLVDSLLKDTYEIAFNAGDHEDVMMMKFDDYCKIVHPTIAAFHRGRL